MSSRRPFCRRVDFLGRLGGGKQRRRTPPPFEEAPAALRHNAADYTPLEWDLLIPSPRVGSRLVKLHLSPKTACRAAELAAIGVEMPPQTGSPERD